MNTIFDFMLIFNKAKFSKDVKAKIAGRKLTETVGETGISYPSLWRACYAASNPDVNTLTALLQWLGKPFEYYLKKEASMKK